MLIDKSALEKAYAEVEDAFPPKHASDEVKEESFRRLGIKYADSDGEAVVHWCAEYAAREIDDYFLKFVRTAMASGGDAQIAVAEVIGVALSEGIITGALAARRQMEEANGT